MIFSTNRRSFKMGNRALQRSLLDGQRVLALPAYEQGSVDFPKIHQDDQFSRKNTLFSLSNDVVSPSNMF
jgi:hypothetical protein